MKLKNLGYRMASLMVLFCAAFLCSTASAQNVKLYIPDFTVDSYDPVTVDIMLDNDQPVTAFSFNIAMPEGLEIVPGSAVQSSRYKTNMMFMYNNNKFFGGSTSGKTFKDETGSIGSFQVKATEGSLGNKTVKEIKLTSIEITGPSTGTGTSAKPTVYVAGGEALTKVTTLDSSALPEPVDLSFTCSPVSTTVNPGGNVEISLALENQININGLQFEVNLPEGFTFVENEDEDIFIANPSRLAGSVDARATNNKGRVSIYNMTNNIIIKPGSGNILSFTIAVPEGFTEEQAEILISGIQFTVRALEQKVPDTVSVDDLTVSLTNGGAMYQAALSKVTELENNLAAAIAAIAENYPDVADQFTAESEVVAAITTSINNLKQAIEDAYANGTLNDNYDSVVTTPAEEIQSAIDALDAAAKDADDAAKAETDRKNQNQAAYDAVLVQLDALQSELDAKKGEYSEEMQAKLETEIAAAQAAIDAAKAEAKEKFDAVAEEGTFEYTVDEDGIKALIAAISDKATEIENAQKALDDANTAANGVVEALQNALNAAVEEIAEKYPDVAAQFTGEDIQGDIDALKKLIEDTYADGSLVTDEVQGNITTQKETISEAIEALSAAAKEADDKLKAQDALDKAQANANVVVGELEAALTTALNTIADECPLVKDNEEFNGSDITSQIETLKSNIAAAYEDGTLAEKYGETVTTPAEAITAAIDKLVEDAKIAQEAADKAAKDEEARQQANKTAYEAVIAQINALQEKYDAEDAKYTDERLAEVKKTAQDAITAAKEAADAEKEAVADAGEFNYTVPTADIEALIAAIATEDAKLKEQDKALKDAQDALDAAKTAADEAVTGLTTALEEAKAEIAEKYPNAEVSYEAVEQMIKDLQTKIADEYATGKDATAVADVESATTAINNAVAENTVEAEISKLIESAKTAQEEYNKGEQEKADQLLRDNAYNEAKDLIDGLKKDLADALATIAKDCADVKDQFTGEKISADIDAMMAAVQAAYDGDKTPAEITAPTATSDEITAAIEQLIADAKAAQKEVDDAATAAANLEKAYKDAKAEIVALNKTLSETLQKIETECPAVKHLFTGSSIQAQINVLKDAVEEAYTGKILYDQYADIVTAEVTKINGLIEKLYNDAKAAQKEGDDEAAAEQARKDAYANCGKLVTDLRAELQEALGVIAKDYADVAADFTGDMIDADINKLAADIDAANVDKTIVEKEADFTATAGTISAAIKKLVEDAKAAQKKLDDENAAKAEALKNALAELEKANTAAQGIINGLNDALKAAMDTIAEKYPNAEVSDVAIKDMINDIAKVVSDAYAAGKAGEAAADVDAETKKINDAVADTSAVTEEITKLLANAKEQQELYDKNEQDKQDQIARDEAKDAAMGVVEQLRKALAAALDTIATTCPDVKDQFTGADITKDIDAIEAAIKAAYEGEKTPAEIEACTSNSTTIEGAIDKLIEDAKAAQKQINDDKEAAEKALKDAIEELKAAKANADSKVEGLNTALAAALDTIAQKYPAATVSDADIKKMISTLKGKLTQAYIDGLEGKTADEVKDQIAVMTEALKDVDTIDAAIEALLKNAADQQKVADDAKAKLEGAKEQADAAILELEKALVAALDTIADKCPDVKDLFPGSEITSRIEALKAAVEAAYKDGSLVEKYDDVMAPEASIKTAIENLVADAKKAQSDKDEAEKAAEIARNEALTNANALIADLNKALADALTTIATDCPDVKNQFTGESIAADIAKMKADIEAAYADKSIVEKYDDLIAPAKGIESAITKLVEDAKAAQAAADKAAALEAAKVKADGKLADLDKALADALKTIATECPDVVHLYPGTAISQSITVLRNAVNTAYANKTLAENYDDVMASAATIEAEIAKMISDAKAAQKEINDAETVRQKYNAEAYEADLAAIAELEEELAKAKIEMDENYKSYNYTESYNKIVAAIANIKAKVEKEKERVAKTGTYSYSVDKLPVQQMIENMLNAAKASGVESIFADQVEDGDRIFTLDGRQVPTLQHGKVNIIVKADGTRHKVFVK